MPRVEWHEREASSWDEFLQIAQELRVPTERGDLAYRGQSNSEHGLVSSLLRILQHFKVTEADALEFERRSIEVFKAHAAGFISPERLAIIKGDYDWLPIMQHYGVATRLLDWSDSIYPATYFAVAGNADKAGAVWIVQCGTADERLTAKYQHASFPKTARHADYFFQPGGDPTLFFVWLDQMFDRIAAQRGHFTVSPSILAAHDQILGDVLPPGDDLHFAKIIIPAPAKKTFEAKLAEMNITYKDLFPDAQPSASGLRAD